MTLRDRYRVWKVKRMCKKFSRKAKKLEAFAWKKYEKASKSLQKLGDSFGDSQQ